MKTNDLSRWWKEASKEDRQKLKTALDIEASVLSNYVYGRRTMPLEYAKIVSLITNLPLENIPYRFVNSPSINGASPGAGRDQG